VVQPIKEDALKKLILALATAAALVFAAAALAAAVTVVDPTPNGAFTGSYTYSCPTPTDPAHKCTATQHGYVRVSTDNSGGPEVQACNGNPAYANPQSGSPLQGYVYLSPTGSGPAGSDYGETHVGANNNNKTGTAAPCPNNPTANSVTP
jgi:hypothetical protein